MLKNISVLSMQYAGIKGLLSRPQIFFLYIKEKNVLKIIRVDFCVQNVTHIKF